MYRTNAQSRAIEEALIRAGIRYQLVGGTRFYERREVKDVARLPAPGRTIPSTCVSLTRVINVPGRGIGAKTMQQLERWAQTLGVPLLHGAADPRRAGVRPHRDRATGRRAPPGRARSRHGRWWSSSAMLNELIDVAAKNNLTTLLDGILERTDYRKLPLRGVRGRRAALGERRGAAQRRLRLRRPCRRAHGARLVPRGRRADLRRGHDQGPAEGEAPKGPRDADHAALGEGPRIPRRLHDRAWRRACCRTSARSTTRRRWRRSGGSLRRHDARTGAAVSAPRLQALQYGLIAAQSGLALPPATSPRPCSSQPAAVADEARRARCATASRSAKTPARSCPKMRCSPAARRCGIPRFGEGIVVGCIVANGDQELTIAFKGEVGIKRLLLSVAPLERM